MPTYRVERRLASQADAEWTLLQEVTTATVPTPESPKTVTVDGLTNGTEYEFRVIRPLEGTVALESRARRALPSQFDSTIAPVGGGFQIEWFDGRGGNHFRVDRWTTATDSPAADDVTSTSVSASGDGSTNGSVTLTGLNAETTYRVQVHRLSSAGGSIQRSTAVQQAVPLPAGTDSIGPVETLSDGTTAQFVSDTSTEPPTTGLRVTFSNATSRTFKIEFYRSVGGVATLVTLQETKATGGSRSKFVAIALDVFVDPALTTKGAVVTVLSGGAASTDAATVTYA